MTSPARWGAAVVVRLGDFCLRAYRTVARYHYGGQFQACGEDVVFDPLTSKIDYRHVRLGARVYIGPGATIGRADIGDDVMLGPNVSIRDGYHAYDVVGKPVRDSGRTTPGRVVIGNDVWIGEGAVLLARAAVPDGVIIGTKALVVGNPAAPIEARFDDDELREHLRRRGWDAARIGAIIEERRAGLAAAAESSGA
jgi:acetyltransferase-like isoleucine patch superfamily enzyme